MRHHLLLLPVVLAVAGCDDKGDTPVTPGSATDWDDAWASEAVYGIANIDDDDADGTPDHEGDALADDENDLTALVLEPGIWDYAGNGIVRLELTGEKLRVYSDGDLLLEDGDDAEISQSSLIEIEFTDTLAMGTLTLTVENKGGEVFQTAEIPAMSAPLLLNNHMQDAELVVAMSDTSAAGNTAFTDGFADVLGDRFRAVGLRTYQYDVWVQDEIEFGTMTSPDHRVDLVIDSVRNNNGRGLDNFPEDEFEAPDFVRKTWGDARASSQDSFGNMEVSPPVTVDGVEYPFGRIYWGEAFGSGPRDADLLASLNAQKAQAPFQLDVSFLCVGHVDEFTTFLPDSSSPKGFRLYVTDTALAWELLASVDPGYELPRYGADKGYDTVQDILDDAALAALNDEIQADYLDPALEVLKAELGLDDDDIVKMPMLFEETSGCGGANAAFFPGTVNMSVATLPGESTTHVFMPDPFFRQDTALTDSARSEDPFIDYIEGILPPNVEPHWLDDWDWYHMMLGEVHCGSNTVRTPAEDSWWDSAMHLIGDDQ
ncbi:MAG: hypothetical protein ACI8S6_002586 [Myxococcota bacterium]